MKRSFREKYSFLIVMWIMGVSAVAYFTRAPVLIFLAWLSVGLLGIDVVYVAIDSYRKARASKDWPTTSVKLVTAYCKKLRRRSGGSQYYSLQLEYAYSINGESYIGHRYNWMGVASTSAEKVEKIAEELKRRKAALQAHYNPANPGESVITPQVSPFYGVGVLLGMAITGFAGLGITGNINWLNT